MPTVAPPPPPPLSCHNCGHSPVRSYCNPVSSPAVGQCRPAELGFWGLNPMPTVAPPPPPPPPSCHNCGHSGMNLGLSRFSLRDMSQPNHPSPPVYTPVVTPPPALSIPKKAINDMQKYIIKETLRSSLDDIAEFDPRNTVLTLKAILSENLSADEKAQFEKRGVWDSIQWIRNILSHPCPENRSTNSEKPGLLSLTAHNGNDTSITKKAVVDYIHQLVNAEIIIHQKRDAAARQIQFWYRRTRDENKVLGMIENKETSVLASSIMNRRR